jgi:hypothetical protein
MKRQKNSTLAVVWTVKVPAKCIHGCCARMPVAHTHRHLQLVARLSYSCTSRFGCYLLVQLQTRLSHVGLRPLAPLQNRATTTLSFKRLGTLDSNVSGLSSRRSASQQCGRPSVSVHSMEQSRSLVPRIAIVVPSQRIDRCPRRRRQTEAATPASSPTRRQQPGGHG